MQVPGGSQSAPGQAGRHPDDPRIEDVGEQGYVDHRVGRDVEGAAGPGQGRQPVGVRDVGGVHHLEAQPRQIWQHGHRRRVRGRRCRPYHPAGQQRPSEQAPLLAGRLPLEDEPGPQPHHPDARTVTFEGVEDPLQIRLLPGVGGLGPAVGRPSFVDGAFPGGGRVGADR